MWWWILACKDDPERGKDRPEPEPTPAPTSPPAGLVFDGDPPRNLLFLSLDTARVDHFGRWDPLERGLTPFLDEWMGEAVVLDDVLECSNWTVASSTCLVSGASLVDRAPALGMVPILAPPNAVLEPVPDSPQLSHWLREAGYDSGLITANDWFGELHGALQGYERYVPMGGRPAADLFAALETGVENRPLASPWYVHLHFFEPHQPYVVPAEYLDLEGLPDPGLPLDTSIQQSYALGQLSELPPEQADAVRQSMRARYEAQFRYFDAQLRAIRDGLEARGMLDDTLVVFATDHGESLWENGVFGHAKYLEPVENRAVVFFWARNLAPAVITEPRATVDVVPTVLEALGRPIPPEVTGISLSIPTPDRVRTAFSDGFGGPVNAVRKGDHLLQFAWAFERPVGLWDVAADPYATTNLYDPAAPSDTARELWALLEPEIRAVAPYLVADERAAGGPPWPPELAR